MADMIWLDPLWAQYLLLDDEGFAQACWQHAGVGQPSDQQRQQARDALAGGSRLLWLEQMRRAAPHAHWPAWPRELAMGLRIERGFQRLGARRARSWWGRRLHQAVLIQALAAQMRWTIQGLHGVSEHMGQQARQLEAQARELSRLGREVGLPATPALADQLTDYYQAFEAHFRGEGLDWAAHYSNYQGWIDRLPQESGAPCVDLGCGRGEWLQHLRQQGRSVQGVERHPGFVAQCRSAGLPVSQTDALAWLQACGDGQIAALSAFHLIEHLPFPDLFQLIEQAARVLQPGGGILLETPNPENPLVGSHTFYHDPTHRHPVTPSSLQFLLQHHGFSDVQIVRSNPYPPQDQFIVRDDLTNRLNGLLCGPQDYAVLAFKPKA
jgi:SAM-dependent methyltransferase